MNYVLRRATKQSIFWALSLVFAVFTACDSGSSGAGPDPVAEVSSSSGDDDAISSSSVTDKGTSSGGSPVSSSSTNSSSSAKSSSSTDAKSSGGDSSPASSSVKSSSSGTSSSSTLEPCNQEGRESTSLDENNQPVDYICQGGFWVPLPKSSSSVKSSSSYFDMSNQYNDAKWITYGTFVDPRDNQEYRTITVEKQVYERTLIILAGNLNYGKMVTAETATYSDGTVEKFCYNDDPWYCENGFGGLYTWSEAMGLPRACDTVALGSTPECLEATGFGEDGRRQGICPEGWHVMNEREWRMMPTSEGFGADPMLSKVFDGDDDIGLAVLLGGVYRESYNGLGKYVEFWYMEEHSKESRAPTFASSMEISALSGQKVDFGAVEPKLSKLPVRCVKDY